MTVTGKNQSTQRNTRSSATLYTTNPTLTMQESMSCGTALSEVQLASFQCTEILYKW